MGCRSLIFGISGQDGAYLSKHLLDMGHEVYGGSRNAGDNEFVNLRVLGIRDRFTPLSVDITDHGSVFKCISEVQPDEIYNLSGQSSVALSFKKPVETYESIATGTLNILESVRLQEKEIRVFNACSSECFGDTGLSAADETTSFEPRSPYAVAKSAAFWMVSNYKIAYGVQACSGILFNHESPFRPDRFVTQKIVLAAINASKEGDGTLRLGNIDIERDWGWAPEYVEAMSLMIQNDPLDDFVIATGESYPLREFVSRAFSYFDLEWENYVTLDEKLTRPMDIAMSRGNPMKANLVLSWEAKSTLKDVVHAMIEEKLNHGQ